MLIINSFCFGVMRNLTDIQQKVVSFVTLKSFTTVNNSSDNRDMENIGDTDKKRGNVLNKKQVT